MSATQAALVWSTFPDRTAICSITSQLLEERLIACANIFSGIESVFTWQDSVQSSEECGALFKTESTKLAALIDRIGQLHPYETPVILGWRCDNAYPATLGWLKHSL